MNEDMELYGIACSDKFYRLAYFISKTIQTDLIIKTQVNQFHSKFREAFNFYFAYDGDSEFYLLESKIQNTPILKKYRNIGYYLLIKTKFPGMKKHDFSLLFSSITVIQASFKLTNDADIEAISALFSEE